ncbi:hypothetical protein E4U53_005194 [Claviceps sorghi]|nr:hypothetical protein E4U53_005194 [Claviceps sorghi]
MAWLLEHLSPPANSYRDIYVYGSYLGASLATSLALTEAHAHANFGVRGLLAYNGIYNWTMFLPDHRLNREMGSKEAPSLPPRPDKESHLYKIHENLPALFHKAANLFDPFASPSLFFHDPGLIVPESFTVTAEYAALINNMMSDEEIAPTVIKVPRKSRLVFPPKQSTLRIPETLIVYESEPPPAVVQAIGEAKAKAEKERTRSEFHSFQHQAVELVQMMRRSIDMLELKERLNWDEDIDSIEATRRVRMVDAGPETGSIEPGDSGCEIISSWIENRF